MDKYVEELEGLRRRIYLTDKENKESKEKIKEQSEKIKKLKDIKKRNTKKINEMKEKDAKIDTMLFDKDIIISSLNNSVESKTYEL